MRHTLPVIIRTSDLAAADLDAGGLRRAVRSRELTRIAPGSYVHSAAWNELDRHQQYELTVRARLDRLGRHLIASHDSAAILWGMPVLDEWPSEIHVIDTRLGKPTRKSGVVRHTDPITDDEIVAGTPMLATTALRTALDLALRDGFVTALMLFDHGLRTGLFSADDLQRGVDDRSNALRIRAARSALQFASPSAESPGESISRAQIILLGFEPPELQRRFVEGGREVARVDFFWPGVGVVGEFDGDEKYTIEALRGGRSVERVMIDEKWRSESLLDRPEVTRVVRWNYAIARNPELLAERLLRAGVPRLPARRRAQP